MNNVQEYIFLGEEHEAQQGDIICPDLQLAGAGAEV